METKTINGITFAAGNVPAMEELERRFGRKSYSWADAIINNEPLKNGVGAKGNNKGAKRPSIKRLEKTLAIVQNSLSAYEKYNSPEYVRIVDREWKNSQLKEVLALQKVENECYGHPEKLQEHIDECKLQISSIETQIEQLREELSAKAIEQAERAAKNLLKRYGKAGKKDVAIEWAKGILVKAVLKAATEVFSK